MSQNHSHSHTKLSGKNLLFSIVLNIIITIAQLVGGFISGSLALISDAVHNFSDVVSLIISYGANVLARKKKQTPQHTFGYKRAQLIAAFVNALSLLIVAFYLIYEAVLRFLNPRIRLNIFIVRVQLSTRRRLHLS